MAVVQEPLTNERLTLMRDWGIKARLATINPQATTGEFQARLSDGNERVYEYMEAMRHGDIFPRPIVTADGVVITGKRTMEAFRRLNRTSTPIILLTDTRYRTATPAQMHEFWLLDMKTNQQNGDRMTDAEIRLGLVHAIDAGQSIPKMAETFGKPTKWIKYEVSFIQGNNRLRDYGLGDLPLTEPQRRFLGRLTTINEEPFRVLAQLSSDAGLRVAEIDKLSTDIRRQASDARALGMLGAARDEYAARVSQRNVKGRGTNRTREPWDFVYLWLAGVGKYMGREYDVFHKQPVNDPVFNARASEYVDNALTVLEKLQTTLVNARRAS
jgi:hypothetical protein